MNAQHRRPEQSRIRCESITNHAFILSVANEIDRETIYRLRHQIYAQELGQHRVNSEGRLCDRLDQRNIYLVAKLDGQLAGFISLTPPPTNSQPADQNHKHYSVDKYV